MVMSGDEEPLEVFLWPLKRLMQTSISIRLRIRQGWLTGGWGRVLTPIALGVRAINAINILIRSIHNSTNITLIAL